MTKTSAIIELQRMTPKELQKEIALKRAECSKMRISIEMGAEKNHAKYRALRREIARMVMVHDQAQKNVTPKTVAPASDVKPTKTRKAPVSSRSPKTKK